MVYRIVQLHDGEVEVAVDARARHPVPSRVPAGVDYEMAPNASCPRLSHHSDASRARPLPSLTVPRRGPAPRPRRRRRSSRSSLDVPAAPPRVVEPVADRSAAAAGGARSRRTLRPAPVTTRPRAQQPRDRTGEPAARPEARARAEPVAAGGRRRCRRCGPARHPRNTDETAASDQRRPSTARARHARARWTPRA